MKRVGMRLARIVLVVGLLAVVGLLPLGLQAEPSGAEVPTLSRQEAQQLLGERADRVLRIEASEIPSFWAVEIEKNRRRQVVYIDFRKTLLLQGDVIRLTDSENLTRTRQEAMNRVDVSRIPLQDALLVGTGRAPMRVVVFTDPKCSYCRKLHEELKKVVKFDPDIAFYIKMMPLDLHPDAYMIAKSIVCNRSLALLEDSFADRFVPPPSARDRRSIRPWPWPDSWGFARRRPCCCPMAVSFPAIGMRPLFSGCWGPKCSHRGPKGVRGGKPHEFGRTTGQFRPINDAKKTALRSNCEGRFFLDQLGPPCQMSWQYSLP